MFPELHKQHWPQRYACYADCQAQQLGAKEICLHNKHRSKQSRLNNVLAMLTVKNRGFRPSAACLCSTSEHSGSDGKAPFARRCRIGHLGTHPGGGRIELHLEGSSSAGAQQREASAA